MVVHGSKAKGSNPRPLVHEARMRKYGLAERLTDGGHVPPPHEVSLSDGLLDAVHLVLVALPVAHGALLGLLQRLLQRLDALHGGAQTLLQLGQLAAQVGVVTHQLLVYLS